MTLPTIANILIVAPMIILLWMIIFFLAWVFYKEFIK